MSKHDVAYIARFQPRSKPRRKKAPAPDLSYIRNCRRALTRLAKKAGYKKFMGKKIP